MTLFFEYLEHGWALTPIRNGSKRPLVKSWARPESAICGSENAHKLNGAAGLLLAHCDPPLVTLDIDDFHDVEAWLNERGVDLVRLLQAGDAIQIDSGRPNRAKLLYHMDRSLKRSKSMTTLPEAGFLRLSQILGNPKTSTPPIIPVSKSTWWAGVKTGRSPKAVKLGPMTTVWRVEDIRSLISNVEAQKERGNA